MHPPFGFALFYLRSVAPKRVKTSDIYWGSVPFVGIQVIMVALIIFFPSMITVANKTDMKEQIELNIDMGTDSTVELPNLDFSAESGSGSDLKLEFSAEPMKK